MKKIVFLVPDGVGIKNYLFSDVLVYLAKEEVEIIIWHRLDEDFLQKTLAKKGLEFKSIPLTTYKDSLFVRLMRDAASYGRLKLNAAKQHNPTILTNWVVSGSLPRKLGLRFSRFYGSLFKSYERVEKLDNKAVLRLRSNDGYALSRKRLEEIQPDLLFCTHQRVPFAAAPMLAAKDLGIKTVTAIFSWDNLPKARLPFRADHYLVWSENMKNDLVNFYPQIPSETIHITGTPQFDFYSDQDLKQERNAFAADHRLDPDKKWICFSGDDKRTSPWDSSYLADVATACEMDPDIQILFRQVPSESVDRYREVIDRFDNVIHVPPVWTSAQVWSKSYPSMDDIAMQINLATHCHAVINVGSTMAMDFAMFDKPGLYLNYDQSFEGKWSVDTIYRYEHFKTMNGMEAVGWVNEKDEILPRIKDCIERPLQVGPDRKKWVKRVAGAMNKKASETVADVLFKLSD